MKSYERGFKDMKKELIKATMSYNKTKDIYLVTFTNKVVGGRVSKSLGSEKEVAEIWRDEVEKIINTDNYNSKEGYLENIRAFSTESVKMVYGGSKFENLIIEEFRKKFYENIIPYYKKGQNKYLENACMLVGGSGVGKTNLLQNLIGSRDYNTPASTTSNTTCGKTVVFVERKSRKLELAFEEISNSSLIDNIKENIYNLIRNLITTDEDDIVESELWRKILISEDLRCSLQYLITDEQTRNQINEVGIEIRNDIMPIVNELLKIEEFEGNKKIIANNFISILDGELEHIDVEYLTKVKGMNIDKYIKKIYLSIKNEKIKVLKGIYRIIKSHLNEKDNILGEIKYLLESNIYFEKDEIKLNQENLTFKSDVEIKIDNKLNDAHSMYISLEYEDGKEIDSMLRNMFFEIMQKISYANTEQASLFPLIDSLTIKGPFESTIELDNKENYIVIDSEGIGHNAGNFEINQDYSKTLRCVDKILWLIDASSAITKTEQYALESLSNNGVLYKTEIVFNKSDIVLDNGDDLKSRIYGMMENLYKEFGDNDEIVNSKSNLNSRILTLGDMNKKISDGKVILDFRGRKAEVELEKEFEKNFRQLLNFEKSRINDKKIFEYSVVRLATSFDSIIKEFLKKYIELIDDSHWRIIKAWTKRMGYNDDNRGYRMFTPEADLKYSFKSELNKIISKPIGLTREEIIEEYDNLQMIQEVLAGKVDESVEKYIYGEEKSIDAGSEWRKLEAISGVGSGNERKDRAKILLESSLGFDRNKNEENRIFKDVVEFTESLNDDSLGKIEFKKLI